MADRVPLPHLHKPRQLTLGDFLVPKRSKVVKCTDFEKDQFLFHLERMSSADWVTSSCGHIPSKQLPPNDDDQDMNEQSMSHHAAYFSFGTMTNLLF